MRVMLMTSWCWNGFKEAAIALGAGFFVAGAMAAADVTVTPPEVVPDFVAEIPPAGKSTSPTPYIERLLVVDINRQYLDKAVLVLEDKAGMLYLWQHDVQRWRLRPLPGRVPVEYRHEQYFPLTAFAGVTHVYDAAELTLAIDVRAQAFVNSTLTTRYDALPHPVMPGVGGFFNYDLLASRSSGGPQRSGLFEVGLFGNHGVGTSNLFANHLRGRTRFTRLDTTWTIDYPAKRQTLRLGDAITVPGSWGRGVLFGGIQFGTNFATQPGYITAPTQIAYGQASAPSTVDVIINHALLSRREVPPGPFSIGNLPVISGAGEVQLVVRDLLGREQVITQPFYGSQALLRKGLASYSFEFGLAREDFGAQSNNYGSWLGSGTYRRGLSEALTGEVRAEAMPGQVTAGAGGDLLLSRIGTLHSYWVASHSKHRTGGMAFLGIDRQADSLSVGAQTQWASSGFSMLGTSPDMPQPVQSTSFNLGYAAGKAGAFSFAFIARRYRDQAATRVATLGYSVSLGAFGSASVSVLRSWVGVPGTTFFAILSMPLQASTNLSVSVQSSHGAGTGGTGGLVTATAQNNLPMGEGYGYRLQTRNDHSNEVSVSKQNNVGTYVLEAAQGSDYSEARLGASGGIAFLGGDAFLSRRIDQSFAVVRIPDYPNVRILADNQPSGRTDVRGNALIPRLRAYDVNVISVDQRDLPIDARIGSIKVDAVPYFHSGMDVTFPIGRSHGATLTLLLESGQAVPLGATAQLVGQTDKQVVGFDGEVYVVGLSQTNRLTVTWLDQRCEVDVTFRLSDDPLPYLGKFICKTTPP